MKKPTIIIIVVAAILVAGAIIFLSLSNKKSPQNGEIKFNENQSASVPEQTYTVTASKEDGKNNLYTDSQYSFSFQYPKSFTATKFSDQEDTSTILVQGKAPSTGSGQEGFQIFISWFDEPGPITKERVLQDLPDLIIKNAENRVLKITVGSDALAPSGVEGLIFFSEEASLGETREIWFIYEGYLYQITATKEIDSLVAAILETWRFIN